MATERTVMLPDGTVITFNTNRTAMTPFGSVVSEQKLVAAGGIMNLVGSGGLVGQGLLAGNGGGLVS